MYIGLMYNYLVQYTFLAHILGNIIYYSLSCSSAIFEKAIHHQ